MKKESGRSVFMLKIFLSCLAIGAVLFSSNQVNAKFPSVPDAPTVAHRGFSYNAPENTLASFRKAIECGAQGCEMDLRQTRDGVIVVSHDDNTKRATGVDLKIAQTNYADLLKLDFSKVNKKFTAFKGEKIPTFEETLQLLQGTSCRPVIEVKANGIEEKVIKTIKQFGLEKTAIIIDFSEQRVKKFRELAPEICCAWLCSYKKGEMTSAQQADLIIKTLKNCGTNVVDIYFGNLDSEFLAKMKAAGIHVWCWTVDDPKMIQKCLDLKMESITTNRPDLVLDLQKK